MSDGKYQAKGDPKIIVALDYPTQTAAVEIASQLDPSLCRVKVGKELFTAAGPSIIEALHKQGFEIFLDLKFHDIPNTVAKAVLAAANMGVWMVNIHASGGTRMMSAAREVLEKVENKPLLIAVTVLTSLQAEDLHGIGVKVDPSEWVLQLAERAKTSGLDGVVCSAREVKTIKQALGNAFLGVTPGIRLPEQNMDSSMSRVASDDQKRVVTPVDALQAGSDYLVVGRPITQSSSPLAALQAISAMISG